MRKHLQKVLNYIRFNAIDSPFNVENKYEILYLNSYERYNIEMVLI